MENCAVGSWVNSLKVVPERPPQEATPPFTGSKSGKHVLKTFSFYCNMGNFSSDQANQTEEELAQEYETLCQSYNQKTGARQIKAAALLAKVEANDLFFK